MVYFIPGMPIRITTKLNKPRKTHTGFVCASDTPFEQQKPNIQINQNSATHNH